MTNIYITSNLRVPCDFDFKNLKLFLSQELYIPKKNIVEARVIKESIDARKKPSLYFVLQVEFETQAALKNPLPKNTQLSETKEAMDKVPLLVLETPCEESVSVVGSGPAGLFAALVLAEAGVKVHLYERGKPVETRMQDIGKLRSAGELNPESNICFGEGGAGTYTDGKLYTRVKDPLVKWILHRLVDFGAKPDIMVKSHPHLGTENLVAIIKALRQHLMEKGVQFHFETKVKDLLLEQGKVVGVRFEGGQEVASAAVILATGHSARDTLGNLLQQGVQMEAKPFAVGFRAEHPQSLINRNQYGCESAPEVIGAAPYALTYQHPDAHMGQRGVYSFCMCPGGFVVPSPTEEKHMAVNGMSNSNRSTAYANSGVVVQVTPYDLVREGYQESPLMGIAFQRDLEAAAFRMTKKHYSAPAMRIQDFVDKRKSESLPESNFRPALEPVNFYEIFPEWILEPLRAGLVEFNKKIKGYVSKDANLIAIESRTSSPVRVVRGEDMQAVSTPRLYPAGEGAGYAGGIVSAALDGIKSAKSIINNMKNK